MPIKKTMRMKMSLFEATILVDTREQRPLFAASDPDSTIRSERATLATGDYSIRVEDQDLRDRVTIERKSALDLLGCLGHDRERFVRELERLKEFPFKAIVVESTLRELLVADSQIPWNARLGSLCSWCFRFGIPIWFCDNRPLTQLVVERLLAMAAKYSAEGQ
jgi:DNA excision repair protein ERCC-4